MHCEVPVGIKYPPQSLLSEAAAKSIGKLHQFLAWIAACHRIS